MNGWYACIEFRWTEIPFRNKLIEDNVNANAAINVGELLKPAPPALLVQMPNGPPLSATEFVQSFDPLNNDNTLEVTLNITRVANVARSATGLPVSTILVTTADGHVIQVKGWRDQAHNTTNQCRVDRKMTIDFLRCQSVTSNFNDGQFLCELVASTRTEFSDLGVALTVSDLPIKTTLNEINTHLGRQIDAEINVDVWSSK
ncbi:hypothetical protein M3Y94_00054400 [Aphelenchoides besseyi]|nr:hypothetical protein M3Y94_00054400 [Aphelenchoides besseyi]